jgi:mannosyl-oligosaccharide alpha-1,3-glucosidase
MNEPSVFNQVDMTLPRRTLFKYNQEFYEHRDAHNAYGYLMHKSSYEALKQKYKKRAFVLTRSFYLGSHKYGAVWTGDTRSTFFDLSQTIPMILSMSISGFSFVGGDVGGFYGEVNPILLYRWYQLGVFYPFFRAHSHNECSRREPWLYDEETLSIIKNSIITRYMLLPYIYSTFFQYFKTGIPVTRPLWFYYKDKLSLENYSISQFFFGDGIMVRPVIKESEHNRQMVNAYLPEEERWYDFYDKNEYMKKGEISVDINKNKIGAFIKGGCIIPVKWRIKRSSLLMKNDPYTLIVALNSEQFASGFLYIDDEESYDYNDQNKYAIIKFVFDRTELSINTLHDKYNITNKIERIVILGLIRNVEEITFVSESNHSVKKLEYEIKKHNVLEIMRIQIRLSKNWRIKLKMSDN